MIQKKKHRRVHHTGLEYNKKKYNINFPGAFYEHTFNFYSAWVFYFYTKKIKLFYTAYNEKTGYCYYHAARLCPYPKDFRFKL